MSTTSDLIYKDECFTIIGLCFKVHNVLGYGFKETIYQEALETEFKQQEIPYEREKNLHVVYNGVQLKKEFRADFVVYDSILLELKAQSVLPIGTFRQTLNYLLASQMKLGLIINFGVRRLTFQRVIC